MKISKKLLVIIAVFSLIIIASIQLYSVNATASDMMAKVQSYAGKSSDNGAVSSAQSIAGSVVSIARVVCVGVAIIMITVLAMKYMTAAPSDRADIKKHAIPYVVGAVIMFAASGILGIIQDFAGILE